MKYLSKLNDAEDVTVQDNGEENNEVKTINDETLPSPLPTLNRLAVLPSIVLYTGVYN